MPPRKFVESCGIVLPSDSPTAYPQVSETYESQVPGLYVIGALAGYPLIKHCLNQGYEVVEYILGNNITSGTTTTVDAAGGSNSGNASAGATATGSGTSSHPTAAAEAR